MTVRWVRDDTQLQAGFEIHENTARWLTRPEHAKMDTVKSRFDKAFAHWNICLPREDVTSRRRGKICQQGWAIWYLFGEDERGEFLDYHAAHRMTSDRHRRVYADGIAGSLPALCDFHSWLQDEETNRILQEECVAKTGGHSIYLRRKALV